MACIKQLLLVFYFLLFSSCLNAQDSCGVRISLLTCAPGEELYSTFGHTAIRVQHQQAGTDHVYNYGTFEFGPDFYTKFIRGKLLYFLSVDELPSFLYQYQVEGRKVVEQELQLSCAEKHNLLQALNLNALEENRYYRYDFLFDNCTTRARDIIRRHAQDSVVFKNILPASIPTFRHLIHSYLDKGKQPWSKLGIDLLLGAKLDRKASNEEAMFLPDYLLKGFDSASTARRPLVTPPAVLLDMPPALKNNSPFTPMLVMLFLLMGIVAVYWIKKDRSRSFFRWFDLFFFFFLGLIGWLLVFMWLGTDHALCANNYNLLWALPTHAVAAFFVRSSASWVKAYFSLVCWLSLLLMLTWFILPQQMNNAWLPVVILIAFRSWQLSKKAYAGKTDNP